MNDYINFLKSKVVTAEESGFIISPNEVNPILKPHQRDSVVWAVRGGRRMLAGMPTFFDLEEIG